MTPSLPAPSIWTIDSNGFTDTLVLNSIDDQGVVDGNYGAAVLENAHWQEQTFRLSFERPLSNGAIQTFSGFLFDNPTGRGMRLGSAFNTWEPYYGIAGTFVDRSESGDRVFGWFAGGNGGPVVIVSRSSYKLLDVRGATPDDGAAVQQFPSNGGFNQQWEFVPTDSGFFKIFSDGSRGSTRVMDVKGASTDDGALIQQFHDDDGFNQQWALEPVGDGFHKIVSRNSGKVLDVPGASTADSVQIQQFHDNGGFNQQWKLIAWRGFLPPPNW
jgi:hypothetical protein